MARRQRMFGYCDPSSWHWVLVVSVQSLFEELHGELSLLTNLPEGSLDRLESLTEGYDSEKIFDPRFAVLLSQCVTGAKWSRPIIIEAPS